MYTPRCDWCGQVATHTTYRTLYEDTVAEQTSKYNECDRCGSMSTNALCRTTETSFVQTATKKFRELLCKK